MYPLPDDARLIARRRPVARIRFAMLAALGGIVLGVPMFAQAGPGLAPSASTQGCRPVGESAQCSIAVSFNQVDGASYYTATLTTPGGAVIPYGTVGAGSASLSFTYDGDGTATVSIAAYGTTETAQPAEVASEQAGADVGDNGGGGSFGGDGGGEPQSSPN